MTFVVLLNIFDGHTGAKAPSVLVLSMLSPFVVPTPFVVSLFTLLFPFTLFTFWTSLRSLVGSVLGILVGSIVIILGIGCILLIIIGGIFICHIFGVMVALVGIVRSNY